MLSYVLKRLPVPSHTANNIYYIIAFRSHAFIFSRLAQKHVFSVMQNKSSTEIYMTAKALQQNIHPPKLIGTARFQYANGKLDLSRSQPYGPSKNSDQPTRGELHLGDNASNGSISTASTHQSKHNFRSNVLRENVSKLSQTQTKSGFLSGGRVNVTSHRDAMHPASDKTNEPLIGCATHTSILKVRRKISFDC